MDEVALGAVSAVWHDDNGQAQRWFELIGEEYRALAEDGAADDWDRFKPGLTQRATADSFAADTVDRFVEYLESVSSSPMQVVAQLADPSEQDTVLQAYSEAVEAAYAAEGHEGYDEHAGHDEHAGDAAAEFDQASWDDYLTRWNGEWDGSDESWGAFTDRFIHYAPQGCETAAQQLVDYVAHQPDKAAALGEYGIHVDGAHTGEATEATEDDQDLGEAFRLLFDEEAIAVADQSARTTLDELTDAGEVPPELAAPLHAAFSETLREIPEAAALSEDELRQLLAEIAAETTATA